MSNPLPSEESGPSVGSASRNVSARDFWSERARETVHSWREMFARRSIFTDLSSGLTVAFVALPLNLALAIACGVPAAVGITTAVIAGLVAGLFGGSRLQISGPAAAMVPLVVEIIHRHGLDGLLVATFVSGVLQVGLGAVRIGRFVQAIPVSVVNGFITGIGLLIIGGQLPRLLSLPADVSSVSGMVTSLSWTGSVDWTGVGLGVFLLVCVMTLPKLSRRLPAALIGLAIVTPIAYYLSLGVSTIGVLPTTFPSLTLPPFLNVDLVQLLPAALAMTALGSIESLLSAVVVDSMVDLPRHSANQELVGQGLANIASSLFVGLPVTGVIVRSSVAVQSGGRTRLVSVSHALALLAMMMVAASVVAEIPRAALAGILIATGLRLTEVHELRRVWRISRFEAGIFIATAAGIVLTDFIVGVALGLVLALVHFAHTQRSLGIEVTTHVRDEAGEVERLLSSRNEKGNGGDVAILRIEGPIFFASHSGLEGLLSGRAQPRYLIIDMGGVPHIDLTGLDTLSGLVRDLDKRGTRVLVARASEFVEKRLESAGVTALTIGGMVHPSVGWALRAIGNHEFALAPPA